MTETLTGAQIAVRLLERQGIRIVTGYPGGAILPIYDALGQSTAIRHVLARHEQGAGFVAQGMARATGQVAVCMASSGPGATNLLTAVADAKLDSIPLVAITGQVPKAMIGTDAFQEVDTYGLSIPITKHNFLVSSAEELLTVIPRAFAIAASGRPGPVLIDIPKDVQSQAIEIAEWPEPGRAEAVPAADPALIARCAALINAAERPVLYLGGGVIHAGAAGTAIELAEKASLPTVMTLMALGAMPVDHALALGMLGMHAARYTNLALEECDLLIAVGARFDDRATGKVAAFCPQAKIVHIDIDPAELGKIKAAHIGIVADVGEALDQLLPAVGANARTAWIDRCRALKTEFPLAMHGAADPRSHFGLIRSVAACLDDEATVATDVGQHQMWTAQFWPFAKPRHFASSGGLGTMGFGLGAAMGVQMGNPEARVVLITGDGSFRMNMNELATVANYGLPIIILLMNNGTLGMVRQWQTMFYQRRYSQTSLDRGPDFQKLAAAFGIESWKAEDEKGLCTALDAAFARRAPALIEVRIDIDETVLPMVPAGKPIADQIIEA